jgi:hypothetical protein
MLQWRRANCNVEKLFDATQASNDCLELEASARAKPEASTDAIVKFRSNLTIHVYYTYNIPNIVRY